MAHGFKLLIRCLGDLFASGSLELEEETADLLTETYQMLALIVIIRHKITQKLSQMVRQGVCSSFV